MTSLPELSRRIGRLKEISSIMTAMKNLSLVETRKLAGFLGRQRLMLENIEAAAADFLHFHPAPAAGDTQAAILLLVGSERGFCGNFNERILQAFQALPPWPHAPQVLVVGQRLAGKLAARGAVTSIGGATVTEEVSEVLMALMDVVYGMMRGAAQGRALYALAHDAEGEPRLERLLPWPALPAPGFTQPPLLHLAPAGFAAEILDQYLLARLHGLLDESLSAESRQRLAHMEHAIDRLEETLSALALKRNALRQEKIIEEIEVMLSGNLVDPI